MIYKSKIDKDQAILQYVGDCISKGVKKSQAIIMAQDKFCIGSPATVYLAIRRTIKRRQENYNDMEGQRDGK